MARSSVKLGIYYAGRPAMAAAAEGSEAAHKAGQRALIERCLRLV